MARAVLPARYPPSGTWPALMRADMAAAYMDFRSSEDFAAAVRRGDAPPPSSIRGSGRNREPIWARPDLDRYIAPLESVSQDDQAAKENLQALV